MKTIGCFTATTTKKFKENIFSQDEERKM